MCKSHGGSAPAVRRAADRRVAQAKAGAFLAGLGIDLEDRDPHQELGKQLAVSAGVAERAQELCSELEDVHTDAGEVHPLFRLWNEERDRVVKTAKVAVSAGVKERALELSREQGQMMVDAVEAALDNPRLNLTETQKATGRRLIAQHLRAADSPPTFNNGQAVKENHQ